ncbi:MAG: PHP domain-containing protein [Ignavibacteria bacterium]|nr:PHP domain-containing protein [Ignavibacteria bacterium]
MKRDDKELAQISKDFDELKPYEENPLKDLSKVESLSTWTPTDYERYYLPRLNLIGIRDKESVILQNVADLHVHTQWSDGDYLDKVLEQAICLRLDAIAITDHDEIEGAFEARRRIHERRLPLAVVPGTEVSSRDGHIGALFVMKKFPKDLSAKETVKLIHEAGGVAIAHHPYTPKLIEKVLSIKLGCGDLIQDINFDAIECTNAVPGRGVKYNIAAIESMNKKHINVAVTGSSDAHVAKFVGKGRTYYAGNEGVVSLKNSLTFGFTKGSEAYWKSSEKFLYYTRLLKAIFINLIKHKGSVN